MLHEYSPITPRRLKAISDKLWEIDEQLGQLSQAILDQAILPEKAHADIEVMRDDLLRHAINPLTAIAQLDEVTAVQRYLEAVEILEQVGHLITAERPILEDPETIAEYLIARHARSDQEILGAVYLDASNRLIADVEIFRGALDRLSVEPRAILRQALARGAERFLLWHTHPSGDPSPTPEDIGFTRRLARSAELLGIRLIDHLILGRPGRWLSLKRTGGWYDDDDRPTQPSSAEGDQESRAPLKCVPDHYEIASNGLRTPLPPRLSTCV